MSYEHRLPQAIVRQLVRHRAVRAGGLQCFYFASGATSCIDCGVGLVATDSGAATCAPCLAGHFATDSDEDEDGAGIAAGAWIWRRSPASGTSARATWSERRFFEGTSSTRASHTSRWVVGAREEEVSPPMMKGLSTRSSFDAGALDHKLMYVYQPWGDLKLRAPRSRNRVGDRPAGSESSRLRPTWRPRSSWRGSRARRPRRPRRRGGPRGRCPSSCNS